MNGLNFPTAPKSEQTPEQQNIKSDDFFPQIDLNHARTALRIGSNVTSERLYYIAIEAVAYVNSVLDLTKQRAISVGHNTLAQTNVKQQINGESINVIRYRRAVYAQINALLLETYADHDATGKSADRADAKQQQADDSRRDLHNAIADLRGVLRNDCELI